ncbi:MAG: sporulation protein YqfD [Turicibacter sp.]
MKNKWLNIFISKIEILIPTMYEVSELRRQGIQIYSVKKHEDGFLVVIAKQNGHQLKVYPVRRVISIYPAFIKIGLPVIILSMVLMVFMNNMTIGYKINGNLTHQELDDLNEILEPHFFNVGPFAFLKTDIELINAELHTYYNEFVWINIYQKGTDIVFDVYDMPGIPQEEKAFYSDTLFAKKSGVIDHYIVESCRVLVELNQVVKVGDPLVTCYVEQPYTNEVIPLDKVPVGEVWADTWYEVNVTAQKNYSVETFTTKKEQFYSLHLAGVEITFPFKEPSFEKYELVTKELNPFFFLENSPFYIEKKQYYEKSDIINTNTYEEIKANLPVLIENSFKQEIDGEFIVKDLEILIEEETDNEVIFKCLLTVNENIAY